MNRRALVHDQSGISVATSRPQTCKIRLKSTLLNLLLRRCACQYDNKNDMTTTEYYDSQAVVARMRREREKRARREAAAAAAMVMTRRRSRHDEVSVNSEPSLLRVRQPSAAPSPLCPAVMNPAGDETVTHDNEASSKSDPYRNVVGVFRKPPSSINKVCSSPMTLNYNEFTTVTSVAQNRPALVDARPKPFLILSSSDRSTLKNEAIMIFSLAFLHIIFKKR